MMQNDIQPLKTELSEAEKDEIRDLLFDSVATELFEPLSLISLNREYLQAHLEREKQNYSPEKVGRALDGIRTASEQMDRQVENCTDLMACLRGRTQVHLVTLDLCSLVEETAAEAAPAAEQLGIALHAETPKEPILVEGDCVMTERILLNFLSNALRASDRGGSVTISVKCEPGGGNIRLMVKDQGCGFSQELADCAFRPGGLRTAPGRERFLGGSGLGLCLCGEFCRLLGWHPAMRSSAKGTSVWADIPAVQLRADGRLVFHSEELGRMEKGDLRAAVRRELGTLPGIEKNIWNAHS